MKLFTQELKEEEKVIKIVHKHWGSFVFSAVKIFLAFSIPFFLSSFLFSNSIGLIIFFILFIGASLYTLHLWMNWYFDLFVLTNQRLINIDQKGIFTREVSEATYANVQGVTYELSGLFAMLFNYGTVKIQAIGIKDLVKIESAQDPKRLQELILEIKDKAAESEEMSATDLINVITKTKDDLSDKIKHSTSKADIIKLEKKNIKDEEN